MGGVQVGAFIVLGVVAATVLCKGSCSDSTCPIIPGRPPKPRAPPTRQHPTPPSTPLQQSHAAVQRTDPNQTPTCNPTPTCRLYGNQGSDTSQRAAFSAAAAGSVPPSCVHHQSGPPKRWLKNSIILVPQRSESHSSPYHTDPATSCCRASVALLAHAPTSKRVSSAGFVTNSS